MHTYLKAIAVCLVTLGTAGATIATIAATRYWLDNRNK